MSFEHDKHHGRCVTKQTGTEHGILAHAGGFSVVFTYITDIIKTLSGALASTRKGHHPDAAMLIASDHHKYYQCLPWRIGQVPDR